MKNIWWKHHTKRTVYGMCHRVVWYNFIDVSENISVSLKTEEDTAGFTTSYSVCISADMAGTTVHWKPLFSILEYKSEDSA
jgi:hypothetical protein